MRYFEPDFLDFFEELSKNNTKAWMDKNRKRYEANIKLPFIAFIDLMIEKMREVDRSLDTNAKESIFRINRDTRFSKNKNPYNTNVSANIATGGRKAVNSPGFYLHFSPEGAW